MGRWEWVISAGVAALILLIAGIFLLAARGDPEALRSSASVGNVIIPVEAVLIRLGRRFPFDVRKMLPPVTAATAVGIASQVGLLAHPPPLPAGSCRCS